MKKILISSGFLLIFFTYCDLNVNTIIKTKDIILLLQGKKKRVDAKAKIELEVSSRNECKKVQGEVTKILKPYFKKIQNPECISKEFKSFLEFKTIIPIIKSVDRKKQSHLFVLYVQKIPEGFQMGFRIDPFILEKINREFSDRYLTSISNDDISLYFEVRNTYQVANVTLSSVYWNKSPVPGSKSIHFPEDEEINLKISDVLRDYSLKKGKIFYFFQYHNQNHNISRSSILKIKKKPL